MREEEVNSPMLEANERARKSMANTMLPNDQEEEAMTQCEKKARECERVAQKFNRKLRGRSSLI